MEIRKVVGVRVTEFTPEGSTTTIKGKTIYTNHKDISPNSTVDGLIAEKVFLSASTIPNIADVIVGKDIKLYYNKYGKPASVEILPYAK